ncbi:hypothetical protein BpOF4_21374 (plasmid) [Alkalihalophilus pseudofirmus OF4]|uniref:Arylamine N-acetyltransferase n=1 Tax=Alkalihalophilus pseudofirmus (strain ATCC BAA-2126 / JCM 17055 / OF4) TaxID=398511 RepID=D3G1P4_ALKPO|nr:arylamine N-acetyltransferase [Alkalihalophilus pseudofirmus]ADC52270.1 hypothetical protein BpOF4_21374 [Alkalihalophilus pseudofirmus OF4]
MTTKTTDKYFDILNINPQHFSSIDLLNNIVFQHQQTICFETATKIKDGEKCIPTTLDNYLSQVTNIGYGGTCFAMSWTLLHIFENLGHEVRILFLEPDHYAITLVVENIEYFVDVSFWAPLFKMYPLRQKWSVEHHGFTITWNYTESHTHLMRNGHIAKTWKGQSISLPQFKERWIKSHDNDSFFNSNVCINRWIDKDHFAMCINNNFSIQRGNKFIEQKELKDDDLKRVLSSVFNVDPSIFLESLEIVKSK